MVQSFKCLINNTTKMALQWVVVEAKCQSVHLETDTGPGFVFWTQCSHCQTKRIIMSWEMVHVFDFQDQIKEYTVMRDLTSNLRWSSTL